MGERGIRAAGGLVCFGCRAGNTVPAATETKAEPAPDVLTVLQKCGEGNRRALITYRKPGEEWVTERVVEPYQLTYSGNGIPGSGGVIVLCWQVAPELSAPAWRNFRIDRIVTAKPIADVFAPRMPVTLHTGEAKRFEMDDDPAAPRSKPSPAQIYFQHIDKALGDLKLTDRELAKARELQEVLRPGQIRALHAQVYAAAVNDTCADGDLTDEEIDRLQAMRVWLNELGWSP